MTGDIKPGPPRVLKAPVIRLPVTFIEAGGWRERTTLGTARWGGWLRSPSARRALTHTCTAAGVSVGVGVVDGEGVGVGVVEVGDSDGVG